MAISGKVIPCNEVPLPEHTIDYAEGHCIKADLRIDDTKVYVELINSKPPHIYITIRNKFGVSVFVHGEPAEDILEKAIALLPPDRVVEIFANLARDKLLADE